MAECYELAPEERLIAMMEFNGALIIATTHRLFEMSTGGVDENGMTAFVIKPILMEKADDADENTGG